MHLPNDYIIQVNMYDVIVIGKGASGISTSLYTTRAQLSTLIIGKDYGALAKTDKIENYYGFESISGEELVTRGINQAIRLGAEIVTEEVVGIGFEDSFVIKTTHNVYTARNVVIASGSNRTSPKISNLAEYEGKGVSYCAVCDAFFYRKKDVVIIGSGDYALSEAQEISRVASSVTILSNGAPCTIAGSPFPIEQKKIVSICGDGKVEGITFEDGSTKAASGIFIAIGTAGSTDLAKKIGAEIDGKNIKVNADMMTSIPNLYAVGDCTGGLLQIAKAVRDGAVAGTSIIKKHHK